MLMQEVGRRHAIKSLGVSHPHLHSINVTYISAGKGKVDFDVDVVKCSSEKHDEDAFSTIVKMKKHQSHDIVSEGILRWTTSDG